MKLGTADKSLLIRRPTMGVGGTRVYEKFLGAQAQMCGKVGTVNYSFIFLNRKL